MSALRRNSIKFIIIILICIFGMIFVIRKLGLTELEESNEQISLNDGSLGDISPSASHDHDWLERVQAELPNVPFDYWSRFHKFPKTGNTSCGRRPDLFKLNFHNTFWQTYQRQNITVQLYSAYYDKREGVPNGPVVRLLAMTSETDELKYPESFCQFWYENSTEPNTLPVQKYQIIHPVDLRLSPGYLYPILITCSPQPKADERVPRTVSLVQSNCEGARNNLRVWYEEPKKRSGDPRTSFAVCVKGLSFPSADISARLVEWLELLRIFGASKVILYDLGTHANVTKTLSYYQEEGFVDLRPLTLANGEPSLPHFQHRLLAVDVMNKRLNEFIPYNDCLYRNMYKFDFIAAIDVDEMIVPLQPNSNWHQLIEEANEIRRTRFPDCEFGFASVCFLNIYFPEVNGSGSELNRDAPRYMHMLRHTHRVPQHSGVNFATKCFHNTSNVHLLHNHFSLTWLRSCRPVTINESLAQLQHYRNPDSIVPFKDLVEDKNIWRFKDELTSESQKVLSKLGFLH